MVLFVGDLDPAGVLIDQSLKRELRLHLKSDIDLIFQRVGINAEQVEEYDLPTKLRKASDRRSREIEYAVEAESMPASLLRSLVRAEVEALLPEGALAVAKVAEQSERAHLRRMATLLNGGASMIDWTDYQAGNHRIGCPSCGRGGRDKTARLTIERDGHGVLHCFRCAYVESFRPGRDAGTPTAAKRKALHERLRTAQRARDAERIRTQRQAADEALRRWNAAGPATAHAYLTAKGIRPHGARIEGKLLLIALHDAAGAIKNLQTINAAGSKRFLPGGAVRGLHFMIGRASGSVVVCEGFATGSSLHEATGTAVAVAFNRGNLEPVARALRSRFPCLTIIVAADDDWRTEGNPGLMAARQAAQAVGGRLAVPDFTGLARGERDTDFNDLARLAGAVRIGGDA